MIKNVVVFGSTGVQGLAQVHELLKSGYDVSAAARNPDIFDGPAFDRIRKVTADYENPESLRNALIGMDALFFQAPAMGDPSRLMRHCENLVQVARNASLQMIVVNSSMWAPDEPCGEMVYDGVAAMENVFTNSGVPCVIFRPTLFMNNLQGYWIKPEILNGSYPYCHKPEMKADWICLEDVAKFMVAALKRPDLAGSKIRIGGPERLTTLEMLSILSEVIGREVTLDYKTPRQFGEIFWHTHGQTTGLDREDFISETEGFYTFNNESPLRPFQADVQAALDLLPIELTNLRKWSSEQDWTDIAS